MPNDLPLSVQLYTVRDLTAKDFAGTVRELARIGYAQVELAGYGNLKSAGEVKRACDDAGVGVSAAHVALDVFEKDAGKVLDEYGVFGTRRLIVPWLPEERRKRKGDWLAVAKSLNGIGETLHHRGYELLYHNHAFEFEPPVDGRPALDLIWENTDAALVKSEVDVYWVKHGGQDPAKYIERLGSRCVALHLKDMAAGEERRFAEVGTGVLDFPAILAAARKAGVASYVVEQDNCYGRNPLESLRMSYENLRRMGA